MEPTTQEMEAQKERRRLQNRESQRRWRERHRLQKAKAAHSDDGRKRKRAATESFAHDRSSSYLSLGCKGCMARASLENCTINVTSPSPGSGNSVLLEHMVDDSFSPEMKYQWAPENAQQSSSTLAYQTPTSTTEVLSDIDKSYSHFQQPAVSSESWPSLQGLQFHHLNQDIPTSMCLDESKSFPNNFSNLNSNTLLNVPSLDYRDDCSSWTNSPGTPVSRSLIAPTTFPYDTQQTILGHHSKRNSLSDNMGSLMTASSSIMAAPATTLMSRESDMSSMNPVILLDSIQDMYLKGLNFGYWEGDTNVLSWLHRTRNRFTDRL